MSRTRVVAIVCAAQFCAQIGAFAVPALLPTFMTMWALSGAEAGWLTGIFYAGYTLAVPVLVALTDRIDPKRVYLFGAGLIALGMFGYALADGFWTALVCRAIVGVGWAGVYMPGLKALSDLVEGPGQSRAVAAHAASVGVSGALSFAFAGAIAAVFGWRAAMVAGGIGAVLAWVLIALLLPRSPRDFSDRPNIALLDFRPALRNRSALAYSLGYCAHTWEMAALRMWVVAFLAFALSATGDSPGLLVPTVIATILGLVGTASSVIGNEASIRFGRSRAVAGVMIASMAVAAVIGFSAGVSYGLAAALAVLFAVVIWADSSSLTAGAVGSADPRHRGATMALHSTLGYAGGFLGPVVMGVVLDAAGGETVTGYGLAFAHLVLVGGFGLAAVLLLRPDGLAGDRGA
jgi:predicted MFS family arabinose efflux permease